jgi:hypothetical protein
VIATLILTGYHSGLELEPQLNKGLSPLHVLQLSQKSGFQPPTSKPDNIGPPTLEKFTFHPWAVLHGTVHDADVILNLRN